MTQYIIGNRWNALDLDRVRRALGWAASETNYTRIAMQMRAVNDKGVPGQVEYIIDSLDALDAIDEQALKIPIAPNAEADADNRLIRKIDVIEYESGAESQKTFNEKIERLQEEHRQRVADGLFLERFNRVSHGSFRMARG